MARASLVVVEMARKSMTAIAWLALGAFLVAPASHADDFYVGGRAYDADHDGYVSLEEWRRLGGEPQAFIGSDDDHDGRLDHDEIIKAMSWDERIKAAEYAGDAWTTAKVMAALLMDKAVRISGIQIVTRDGTVKLSGVVRSDEEAQQAARVASRVEGVRKVINALTVKAS